MYSDIRLSSWLLIVFFFFSAWSGTHVLANDRQSTRNSLFDLAAPPEKWAGELRVVGEYPLVGVFPSRAHAYSTAVLPSGDALVYGGSLIEIDGLGHDEIRNRRRNGANSALHREALWWKAEAKGWKKLELPPECTGNRVLHAMTTLSNGKVLISGGWCDEFAEAGSTDSFASFTRLSMWNSASGKWEPVSARLAVERIFHTASLLRDGSVLFAGGVVDPYSSSPSGRVRAEAELFNAGKVVSLPPMKIARARHSATLLNDGSLLVVGGMGEDGKEIGAVEIWDPASQAWRDTPPLKTARYKHSAVLLIDGRVMVSGGIGINGEPLASVEIWDPKLQTWSEADPLFYPLSRHSTLRLANGDVLLAGGLWSRGNHPGRMLVWNQASGRWRPAGVIHPNVGEREFPTVTLAMRHDGSALIFDFQRVLQWSPELRADFRITPQFGERDLFATAPLENGRLMISGGRLTNLNSSSHHSPFSDSAEILDTQTGRFSTTGRMRQLRIMHSLLPLGDGSVVAAGGWVWERDQPGFPVANSPEVWDPSTGNWRLIQDIRFAPQEWVHMGRLQDGKILFFASDEASEANPAGQAGYRAWLWDPGTGQVEKKHVGAKQHSAAAIAILPDGRVVRVGGNLRSYKPGDSGGQWEERLDATADIWDSRNGVVTRLADPPGWSAREGKALVLRNGDAVFIEYAPAKFGSSAGKPQSTILRWSAQDGSWHKLPDFPGGKSWPMLERQDGALWTLKHYLPSGAATWSNTPSAVQDEAVLTQMPSGELLAFSTQTPFAAMLDERFDERFDERQLRWLPLVAKDAPPIWQSKPVALALSDGRVMAIGQIERSRHPMPSAFIWNPHDGGWRTAALPLHPLGRAAQALLLPSGNVLYASIGAEDQLNCEIWQKEENRWEICDSPIMTGAFATMPGLGLLDDGRAALIADTITAYVFNEPGKQWVAMKGEWNPDSLVYGIAARLSTPLQRIFDESNGKWIDSSAIAARYWEQFSSGSRLSPAYSDRTARIMEPQHSSPDMLWDTKKRHWAYIFSADSNMGAGAQLLPDGCAFSWFSLGLFNPVTGAATHLAYPGFGISPSQSANVLLADGSMVFMGVSEFVAGSGFFRRKVACSGFEAQSGDSALIFPRVATEEVAPRPAPSAPAGKPWWREVGEQLYTYRWAIFAAIAPFGLYFLLQRLILPYVRRGSRRLLPKRAVGVLSQELPRSYAINTRIVIYGALLLFFFPGLFVAVKHKLAGADFACEEHPSGCLDKETGILRSVSKLEGWIYPRYKPEIPCRYIGTWISRRGPEAMLLTFNEDGTYSMKKPEESGRDNARDSTGYWMVQRNHMVWRHNTPYAPELDINPILTQDSKHFELKEAGGSRTQFELVQNMKSNTCKP